MTAPDDDPDDKLLDDVLDDRPAADVDEAARRAPYEHVIRLLRQAPPPAPGWAERVDARVAGELRAQRRRRRVAAAIGIGAIALAAVVVLAVRPHRQKRTADAAQVAIRVEGPDGGIRRGAVSVGDTLRLSVPATASAVTLRVYRQARPVLVCPGAPTCALADGTLTATLRLEAAGTYQIVYASAAHPLPPAAADTSFDADVMALRRADARLVLADPLIVSP